MNLSEPHPTILSALEAIQAREDIRIVYACESGSRAWGMASIDSDYDVRFLYAHRPEWYLSLEPGRDVIELPISDALDISGWDLRKAMRLFGQSNPTLLEWLDSPIVYRETPEVVGPMRDLIPTVFSPERAYHHYWHQARGFHRRYASGEGRTLKRFFYLLRTLLAALWIDARETAPPMELARLAEAMLPAGLHPELVRLLEVKRAGRESDVTGEFGPLWAFVERELGRLNAQDRHFHRTWPPMDQLNILFRRFLDAIWKNSARE